MSSTKRKRLDDANLPSLIDSPKRPKRLFGASRRAQRSRHDDMTELVHFILGHEKPFQSSGRLASLYADFSSQHNTNPEGYQANLAAWRNALTHATRAGVVPAPGGAKSLLTISSDKDLARALNHAEHGIPTCLPAVLQDAIRRKDFVPVHEWQTSQENIYKKSWVPSFRDVIRWGATMVIGSGTSNTLPVGRFVVVRNVEEAAEGVLAEMKQRPHTSTADRILSRAAFLRIFGEVLGSETPLSKDDLDVLLTHMARDKNAVSFDRDTIKFKAETEETPTPITPEERTMASLRDSVDKIHAQLLLLQAKIDSCQEAAREAVEAKQMIRAKTALRSRKLAESALTHQSSIAIQLEEAYMKLQHAADQVEIVEAMKAGAEAMKALHEKVGGAEGVQKVMDDVNEQITTVDEITNIINESAAPVDEGEIDDEFEAMARAEKAKEEAIARAERQRIEAEEAEKTAIRLAELDKAEKARKEKEKEKERERQRQDKKKDVVEETSHSFSQLTMDQDEGGENNEEERIRIPA